MGSGVTKPKNGLILPPVNTKKFLHNSKLHCFKLSMNSYLYIDGHKPNSFLHSELTLQLKCVELEGAEFFITCIWKKKQPRDKQKKIVCKNIFIVGRDTLFYMSINTQFIKLLIHSSLS